NNAYSGPSANTAPYNQKTIARNYGFGTTQGTGSVTIGGIPATVTSWGDSQIAVTVPGRVPNCSIQQQIQYSHLAATATAQCGELMTTGGNRKTSIDPVTVTIGGKAPTHVPTDQPTIQAAIDHAHPGDLIIGNPGQYQELIQMWKPVRLQGVGAASSV